MTIRIDGTNTASNPGITGADADTGLQFGTNEVKVVTGGTEAINVKSDQTVAVADNLTVNGVQYPNTGPLSNRNLFENGAMTVAQRGASTTGITSSVNLNVDRFIISMASLGTWTSSQEADGPTGFANSLKLNCTTADASPATGDYAALTMRLEGQNLQELEYGTSNAKDITISFYVKSNKTGNASFEITQADNSDKHYSVSYNIPTAGEWEPISFTIPGDTAGQIDNDNGIGFQLFWWLNSGSTYSGGSASNAWQTLDNTDRNHSNIGIGGAVNDYFQITGLQIEVGDKATPFEHRSYKDYLAKCQRYFQGVDSRNDTYAFINFGHAMFDNVNSAYAIMYFQTEMRVPPTAVVISGGTGWYLQSGGTAITNWTTAAINTVSRNSGTVRFTGGSGGTNGRVGRWLANNNTNSYCFFSAEL